MATLDMGGSVKPQTTSSLSAPTTPTSSGTVRPESLQASMTRCPQSSLQAITPTGLGSAFNQLANGRQSFDQSLPGPDSSYCGGFSKPAARIRRQKNFRRMSDQVVFS